MWSETAQNANEKLSHMKQVLCGLLAIHLDNLLLASKPVVEKK